MTDEQEFFDRLRIPGDPVADPAAQVVVDGARFTVLTSRLLRLEWTPDGRFEDRGSYAVPHRRLPVPAYDVRRDDDGTTVLDTGDLILRHRPDGAPLSAANTGIELAGALRTSWVPGQADPDNLGGARRTVDECWGDARLEPGLVSRAGWALVDDSDGPLFTPDGWIAPRASNLDAQDWYFFGHGHDYAGAVGDYTKVGGGVPLLPRWMLGAWWSRYFAYSDGDLRALVTEFRDHDLPLDVLVVDMDWHTPDAWTGYTWNRDLFPDPPAFLDWVHEQGLHTTLNLHPALGVQAFEEAYPAVARRLGIDPATRETVPFRIGDRAFVRAYFEELHHPLEDQGVDFWWMDWQQGRDSELSGLDPLPWLNHLHFADLARRPDRRPVGFSRWGGLGSHRYPIGFSGDSGALWSALRFQPRYTAAGANVGYGWWSHDIGGHFGADEPELYVRWVQFGALSPVLRLHSSNDPLNERRPWGFDEPVLDAARAAFRLRYALVPYLYTATRTMADTGVATVRPMSWLAPECDAAYVARYQYLLGPDIVAAPVMHAADPATGLATVDVWVPPGEWVERRTLETFVGPRWVRLVAGLDDVPQLVRAGAVLPLAEVAPSTGGQATDHLVLSAYVGADGTSRVYDDDGTSSAHTTGAFTWTDLSTESPDPTACSVTVHAAEGQVDLGPRRYTVRLEGTRAPVEVRLDGVHHLEWRYDDDRQQTVVEVPHRPRSQPWTVTARADGPICMRGAAHDQAVRAADLGRLLSPGATLDDVLALAADHPSRPAAIARVGGPGIQVIEHVAPDEAVRTLGRVVVSAAESGPPVTVETRWTVQRAGEVETTDVGPSDVTGDGLVLDVSGAWDGPLVATRWSVDVVATWGDVVVRLSHDSDLLMPALASWRVAMVARGATLPPGEVLADLSAAEARLTWAHHTADPADPDYSSLAQPYIVSVREEAEKHGDPRVVVYAAATVVVPADRDVAFAYTTGRSVVVHVDGKPVAADVTDAAPVPFHTTHPWNRRTAGMSLTAGEHVVVFTLTKDADEPWYDLYLSAQAVNPVDGTTMLDVTVAPTNSVDAGR